MSKRVRKPASEEQKRRWNLSSRYGLTAAEVDKMLAEQSGKCAICSCILTQKNARIDHCHQTNRVRGILCHQCNINLPVVEDASFIMCAWAYLDEKG